MDKPLERLLAQVPARSTSGKSIRPSITVSYAQSLDGSIASPSSRPLALSSPDSLVMTHNLRAAHDAILVGIGTVLADNPRLTARKVEGESPQPVVLDTHLRLPEGSSVLEHPKPLMVATGPTPNPKRVEEVERRGGRVLSGPTGAGGLVQLPSLVERLRQLGIASLMVEGGTKVISSFLREGLVDTAVITITPAFVGGRHAVDALGFERLEDFPRLKQAEWSKFGPDIVVWGDIEW